MPNWDDILKEIKTTPNQFDFVRRKYLAQLSELTERNTIIYYSGWLNHQDPTTTVSDEDLVGFMNSVHELDRNKGLDLVLHTPGGGYHAAINLVRYPRDMFDDNIRVIVPQIAMSAGTIMACMGKEIIMGKHSNLGPIDPQIGNISAANVKEEFERIKAGEWSDHVVGIMLSKYPPTFINEVEKLLQLSQQDVSTILADGMFKNEMNSADATVKNIVEMLSNPVHTKSHSRPLSKEVCKSIGLKISDLEADPKLQDAVLSIHHACIHTIAMAGRVLKIIENQDGKAFIKTAQLAVQQIPLADQQGQTAHPKNQMEDDNLPKVSP